MIADTLYTMLSKKLRGFEDCDAPTLYRNFVRGKGIVEVDGRTINVMYPRRAHNPVLRQVLWDNLPLRVPNVQAYHTHKARWRYVSESVNKPEE